MYLEQICYLKLENKVFYSNAPKISSCLPQWEVHSFPESAVSKRYMVVDTGKALPVPKRALY